MSYTTLCGLCIFVSTKIYSYTSESKILLVIGKCRAQMFECAVFENHPESLLFVVLPLLLLLLFFYAPKKKTFFFALNTFPFSRYIQFPGSLWRLIIQTILFTFHLFMRYFLKARFVVHTFMEWVYELIWWQFSFLLFSFLYYGYISRSTFPNLLFVGFWMQLPQCVQYDERKWYAWYEIGAGRVGK